MHKSHNVLISEVDISTRVDELAKRIAQDIKNEPTILVGLLSGSVVFLSDLMRRLYFYGVFPEIDFIMASSYKDGTVSSGMVEVLADIRTPVEGRTVILVDDIMDTGYTLSAIKKLLMAKNPAKVLTCVLLDKPSRRKVDIAPDYKGFSIEDVFVVGYGMDAANRFRYLPYLAALE